MTVAQARSTVIAAAKQWDAGAPAQTLREALEMLRASEECERRAMLFRVTQLRAWMERPVEHFRKMHAG